MAAITLESLRARQAEILAVAERWGARHVRVFGSVARGDATETSDVDFLVEFEPDRSLLDQGGLLMDLSALLNCPVDVVDAEGLHPRLRENIFHCSTSITF